MLKTDILIVGGGAAGMAAALAACKNGASVVLAEQSGRLGGILNRCTHHGFGLGYYEEDLTGQQYAERYRRALYGICAHAGADPDPSERSLTILTDTTVISVSEDRSACLSAAGGITEVSFRLLIMAAGSYERPIEYEHIAGTRPAGVMTAGCAQGLINEDGLDIGGRIVILGSGNVGQIMAGQLADAGKEIVAMIEQNSAPGGLARNIHEYIEGRNIPLILNSTISRIHGAERISGVTLRSLIDGSERFLGCDTLISALGLIPDRSLTEKLSHGGRLPGWVIFAGNCDHIYDFADAVTSAGEQAGARAASMLLTDPAD